MWIIQGMVGRLAASVLIAKLTMCFYSVMHVDEEVCYQQYSGWSSMLSAQHAVDSGWSSMLSAVDSGWMLSAVDSGWSSVLSAL